jgi:hypothetical protein
MKNSATFTPEFKAWLVVYLDHSSVKMMPGGGSIPKAAA